MVAISFTDSACPIQWVANHLQDRIIYLIQPNASDYAPAHYQGYYVNNIIQIEAHHSNNMLNNRQHNGPEYARRNGWMVGTADNGTLILRL